jgi:excisionase family DNA binding protein
MSLAAQIELPEAFVAAIVEGLLAALGPALGAPGAWLTLEEAASYLRMKPDALRQAAYRRQIPAHQPQGPRTRYLFSRSELDDWVANG